MKNSTTQTKPAVERSSSEQVDPLRAALKSARDDVADTLAKFNAASEQQASAEQTGADVENEISALRAGIDIDDDDQIIKLIVLEKRKELVSIIAVSPGPRSEERRVGK